MITKLDALGYFNQILKMEKEMEKVYNDMVLKVKDADLIKQLKSLANDEHFHAEKVLILIGDLDKYWKE